MLRRHVLPFQIKVGAKIDGLADGPSQSDTNEAPENPHRTRFRKEKFLHVSVTSANRLHDPDFTASLEDRHHQSVYNSDGGNSQGETSKDSQEQIQHCEELPQAA